MPAHADAGALGAVFLYEVVAIYRIPVIVFAVAGTGALIWRTQTVAAPGEPGGESWAGLAPEFRAGYLESLPVDDGWADLPGYRRAIVRPRFFRNEFHHWDLAPEIGYLNQVFHVVAIQARLAAESHGAAIDKIEQIVREERIDCSMRERTNGSRNHTRALPVRKTGQLS